jgi:hypothetical protein
MLLPCATSAKRNKIDAAHAKNPKVIAEVKQTRLSGRS